LIRIFSIQYLNHGKKVTIIENKDKYQLFQLFETNYTKDIVLY